MRILAILTILSLLGCKPTVPAPPAPTAATQPAALAKAIPPLIQPPLVLHLPGIGGHMPIDDHFVAGLDEGFGKSGVEAKFEIYDWTGSDRGLIALCNEQRHDEQSTIVAKMIADLFHANPRRQIILTSHSAGCGIAVWALEKLPDDVVIDELLMMQSALSPKYDLSRALRHVRHAYALYSADDTAVLGAGTTLMGTVDRVHCDAAGRVGYQLPPNGPAYPGQYDKLKQFAYNDSWMRFGDIGDHIGPMTLPFARFMAAPLLLNGSLPAVQQAATQAAAAAAVQDP